MSAEESKALLRRYIYEVWEKQNPTAVKQFLAPNYRRHTSPESAPLTVDEQVQRLTGFRTSFPDIEIKIVEVVAEGNVVAFRSTMHGTHLGELMGVAPTGREVKVNLLDMIRVEKGKIVEQWGGPDLFDLLRQLGAVLSVPSESS